MFLAVVFHSAIRFMILKKMNTKVVIFELQQVYGSDSASERIVYGWGAQFKHGRTGVFDEKKDGKCSGQPTEISENTRETLGVIV